MPQETPRAAQKTSCVRLDSSTSASRPDDLRGQPLISDEPNIPSGQGIASEHVLVGLPKRISMTGRRDGQGNHAASCADYLVESAWPSGFPYRHLTHPAAMKNVCLMRCSWQFRGETLPLAHGTQEALREHLMSAGELLRSNALRPVAVAPRAVPGTNLFEDVAA